MSTVPVLLYDGDCGFCTRSVRLAARFPADVALLPWQAADVAALGTTESRARREVVFVDEYQRVHGGAAAVAALLRRCGPGWRVVGRALGAPGIRPLAERVYRLVADNRHRLPGTTPACHLPSEQWPG
ncbi:putative DCC family thiol-disulfide oxidoreductase YuxK [Haloactinospora alba]|uniref:Putative DCC family thiol-disulfide oxidoreductase YuxK n=1 Tax=Haloactinospora alba TaxID=405555 RepID=A0A543NMC3_9ACTN|nr:DUF393 domain-containing protein [Haloactinospora alba]TQN32978.1 putative DCC family thiol-disulfide oxidoreductase YuxK [Haloactinospora alba]